MNDCICLIRTATMTPKAVTENASSSCSAKTPSSSAGSYGTWTAPARQITSRPLEPGRGRAAKALADDDRAAPHRGHHHLAQEAELAVPHDRRGREHRGEHDRDAEDAGVDERLEVDAVGADAGELVEPRAEHEQEEQRLHQRGDDPQAVAAEAH